MSAILSWASSGAGTKTGTTNAALIDDLDTLVTSKAADATFFWEKAGKSNSGTPRYLLLRRKDGSAGRLAIVIWDSSPAANHTAILEQTPTAGAPFLIWFPAGTGTTLSNLTAASGTICGNDTGVIKAVGAGGTASNVYATSCQAFYMDCAEGMFFGFQDPGAAQIYSFGGGALVVDAADTAWDCGFQFNSGGPINSFASPSTSPFPFNTTAPLAGALTQGHVRTNYGASGRVYMAPWLPSSNWAAQAPSSTDILTDTANNKAWFVAMPLMSVVKGEGPVLKLRQIGFGPGTVGPLTAYNTTGPVAAARQFTIRTTGLNGGAWFTNFKI